MYYDSRLPLDSECYLMHVPAPLLNQNSACSYHNYLSPTPNLIGLKESCMMMIYRVYWSAYKEEPKTLSWAYKSM
jgi:hypothetical protein